MSNDNRPIIKLNGNTWIILKIVYFIGHGNIVHCIKLYLNRQLV